MYSIKIGFICIQRLSRPDLRCCLFCIIAIIGLLSSTVANANERLVSNNQEYMDYPLIPFNTNFWNYWDHYWMTWLDGHPVYEAIELTAFDNPENPEYQLLRVFLSEKTGRKKQYFYLNDQAEVFRSRANSYYRDMIYKKSGDEKAPQNLYLEFKDKDNQLIRWSIDFRNDQILSKHRGGLTPSIHSIGYIFLYHLRIDTASSTNDKVYFDGVDYSFTSNSKHKERKLSWYNKDIYSAVVIFGKLKFWVKKNRISNSWGRTFEQVPENSKLYRSNLLAKENQIEFEVDERNQLKYYQQKSFEHTFRFTFNPALPNKRTSVDKQKIEFKVSFDDNENLSNGYIIVGKEDGKILYNWHTNEPEWARARPFKSIFSFNVDGYDLTTLEIEN